MYTLWIANLIGVITLPLAVWQFGFSNSKKHFLLINVLSCVLWFISLYITHQYTAAWVALTAGVASLVQAGLSHKASLVQAGLSHKASLVQAGLSHKASLVQAGLSHKASLVQAGLSHKASLVQAGLSHKTTNAPTRPGYVASPIISEQNTEATTTESPVSTIVEYRAGRIQILYAWITALLAINVSVYISPPVTAWDMLPVVMFIWVRVSEVFSEFTMRALVSVSPLVWAAIAWHGHDYGLVPGDILAFVSMFWWFFKRRSSNRTVLPACGS